MKICFSGQKALLNLLSPHFVTHEMWKRVKKEILTGKLSNCRKISRFLIKHSFWSYNINHLRPIR